jgi:protein phosphatase
VSAPPRAVEAPAETLRLTVAAESDTAGREANQDVALAMPVGGPLPADEERFLLVVADGMGGQPAGDVASRVAAETVRDAFAQLPEGDFGLALKQAYRQANDAVFLMAEAEPAYAGMGTTLVSALLRGKYAAIANVGDSRAYLLRGEALTQVTRDHTLVADEAAAGRITAEAAQRDPRRNVLTQAIGSQAKLENRLPNVYELTLLPGDRLLLCSDGLYDVLDEVDLRRALGGRDPDVAVRDLIALAKERGTRDNASAVVAAAIPTRIPVAAALPAPARPTGGLPGAAIAAAVAILLILLLILAVVVLGGGIPR